MNNWRTWNLRTWNEHLLAHFFRCQDEQSSPVVVLLVTAEELARATSDRAAKAEEARNAFVDAVRIGIRREKSLIDDACDYQAWPGPPRPESPPRFVAHLLFTCIAASESSDELADEGSFITRLRELTEDQLPEHTLQQLPRLWENLASWLNFNREEYRNLRLPAPGVFTRIGYTVKLSFPDRRDQRQLSDLLDRAGIAGHEPPVGRVISLVASERGKFRQSFIGAFDEFRRLFEKSSTRFAPGLVEHRLWAAVRDASSRGRGQMGLTELSIRVSFLCEEQDGRLALFLAAEEQTNSSDFACLPLPISYGEWRFALLPSGTTTIEAEQLENISRDTLAGKLRFHRISSYVAQGFLPFAVGLHGLLELAAPEQFADANVALVHKRVLKDFLSIFGPSAYPQPSSYSDWVQVHEPRLRAVQSAELDGTTLTQAWFLHELLVPTAIRMAGGVRVEDGWLGFREMLPRVVAQGASDVLLQKEERIEALVKVDGGDWTFPLRDMGGEFVLLASLDGVEQHRRTIRFHEAPASEAFKQASEPDAWIVEGLGGTVTSSESAPFSAAPHDFDYQNYADRVARLGTGVGQFVTDAQEAAWIVIRFGGKLIGTRSPGHEGSSFPTHQIDNAHARRRWRKLLFESVASRSDPGFDDARRSVKTAASSFVNLPKVDAVSIIPELTPIAIPRPAGVVDRLVQILASRASARAGLAWNDWAELAKRVLNIDDSLLKHVTRAWMESGLIDTASYARWWHRSIFARTPRLVAFRSGDYLGATLMGLALPATLNELHRVALRMDVLVEERFSTSPLVPRTLAFRFSSARQLHELSVAHGIEISWINFGGLSSGQIVRHDVTSVPPSHYEWMQPWKRWSLAPGAHAELEFVHHMRRGRPDFWVVSHGTQRIWSYELNVARSCAAVLLGSPILEAVGDTSLEANHAYLPLPLARVASVIGAGLPGPNSNGRYVYPLGFYPLREHILDIMTRTFDTSRLAASAASQAEG